MARRHWRTAVLLAWAVWGLAGCGASLQADDAATTAICARARELYDAGEHQKARDKAELALGRDPKSAAALYVRALAALKLGDAAGAKADLSAAKALDPLLLFAADKAEFEAAFSEARAKATAAPSTSAPPAGQAPETLNEPEPAANMPTDAPPPSDPAAAAIAPSGAQTADLSGASVFGDPQLKAIATDRKDLADFGIELKMLVLETGADLMARAHELHTAAGLGPQALVVLGDPSGAVGVYSPLLPEPDLRKAVDEAAAQGDAGLVRRMIRVARALAKPLRFARPPATEPTPSTATPAPPPAPMPIPEPEPGPDFARLGLYAGGGLVAAAVLLVAGTRVARGRRLSRGFGVAQPRIDRVAAGLTQVATRLSQHPHRPALRALQSAELAYFDALAMLREADAKDTGDVARVERAVRLLDEAEAKLAEATAQAEQSTADAEGPFSYCYFTGRPLFERFDHDLVKLRAGGAERLVLASRQFEGTLRRGELPPVRTVGGRHWATVPEFEPLTDFYSDRLGLEQTPLAQLAEPLPAIERPKVYLDLSERPDYTLDLDKKA